MKLWLVSCSNRRYAPAQKCLIRSAQRFGFEQVRVFGESHLHGTDFFRQHQHILSAERGAGYWLWKPFYIAQVLQEAHPGDIVVYSDAAIEFIADPCPLIDICLSGPGPVLFQTHDHPNSLWTKRDCFVGMNCDTPQFHQAQQLMGGFQIYRRCEASQEFVNSLLSYCCRAELVTDAPNTCGLPNHAGFVAHRHDQSILSLLAEKWRLPIYRGPSQFGSPWALPEFRPANTPEIEGAMPYENSPYGEILNVHRRRKGPKRPGIWSTMRAFASLNRMAEPQHKAA